MWVNSSGSRFPLSMAFCRIGMNSMGRFQPLRSTMPRITGIVVLKYSAVFWWPKIYQISRMVFSPCWLISRVAFVFLYVIMVVFRCYVVCKCEKRCQYL
jgi:hypothetical protein